jgi:hypothetical protein
MMVKHRIEILLDADRHLFAALIYDHQIRLNMMVKHRNRDLMPMMIDIKIKRGPA